MAPGPRLPPATSTRPSLRTAAVWKRRGVAMLAAADQVPVVGSNSSAESSQPPELSPPATSTLPSCSSVAVWFSRPLAIAPGPAPAAAVIGAIRTTARLVRAAATSVQADRLLICAYNAPLRRTLHEKIRPKAAAARRPSPCRD